MEQQLPTELLSFMQQAGELAYHRGQSLYLVGGVVRDLLRGAASFDLDLVVTGNALELAGELVKRHGGEITTHPRFHTAKLKWAQWSVDLVTARSETYVKPGALPSVKPDTIGKDLFRRDFTINTMAINLSPGHYGELIDPFGGRDDLEH